MSKSAKFFLCFIFLCVGLFADQAQFGLNTNNYPCQDPEGSPVRLLFEQLNIEWIRAEIPWHEIEPIANQPIETRFNFDPVDILVQYAQIRNINIYFVLTSAPTFYSIEMKDHLSLDIASVDKWSAFVNAMVERYDGDGNPDNDMPGLTRPIKHWGIWNEPNHKGFWHTGIESQNMPLFRHRVLNPGIAAIRAADPQAMICGPDLSSCCDPLAWFNYITDSGAIFDVLTHHQYDGGDSAKGRFAALQVFHNLADSRGYAGKEFWITETGWPVDNSKGDAVENMREMLQYMLNSSSWWNKTFWFAWRDLSGQFPLIDAHGVPTAPYYTFKSFTNPPHITVTSPNGGEIWARGTTCSIQWNSTDVANVKIELWKNNVYNKTIAASTPAGSGLKNWYISPTQGVGSKYKIRIISIENAAIYDSSNASFTIGSVPGDPILASPADNATMNTTTPTFTWNAVAATPVVDYYQLQINNANGSVRYVSPNITGNSFTLPAASQLEVGQSYAWYVRAHNSLGLSGWSGRALNVEFMIPPPVFPGGTGIIPAGYGLGVGQEFYSNNYGFLLTLQYDGNLVLYKNGVGPLWASYTGNTAYGAYMQADGNLVIYNQQGVPIWASNTGQFPGAFLAIQDDGNMVIYHNGNAVWATNTGGM